MVRTSGALLRLLGWGANRRGLSPVPVAVRHRSCGLVRTDDGRQVADLRKRGEPTRPPAGASEGPTSRATGLLGGDGVGVLGHELVDEPGRRAGAGGAVLVGEAAVGHGRGPNRPRRTPPEAPEQRLVGHAGAPALERDVRPVEATPKAQRWSRSTFRILRERGPPQK